MKQLLLMSRLKKLSRRNKYVIGLALPLVIGGSALALSQPSTTGADEKPPIVIQVENHEKRIGDLEDKTDATQTQTDQNSADIKSIQSHTGASPAPTVPKVSTSVERTASQEPSSSQQAPTQTATPNPRLITAVQDTPNEHTPGLHNCTYTLYDPLQTGRAGVFIHAASNPCLAVGDILPY